MEGTGASMTTRAKADPVVQKQGLLGMAQLYLGGKDPKSPLAAPLHADFKGLPHELAARNKLLGAEKPVGIGWRAEDLNPAGVCGNAARADGRRGAQHLTYLADRLAALVSEVAATPLTILR